MVEQERHIDNSTDCSRKGRDTMDTSIPLIDYIHEWLATFKFRAVKQATYDRLITSVHALETYDICDLPIGEITPFVLQRYVNKLASDYASLSTVKKQMRIVTSPLKHAASLRIISSDPTYGVKIPKSMYGEKDVKAYSVEEQKRLMSVISSTNLQAGAVIAFILQTGLRPGEALALRWKDVDIPARRFKVSATVIRLANRKQARVQESPKSKTSRRTIPLTPTAVDILERQKMITTGEFVFENGDGGGFTYESFRYQTQKICCEAGVPYLGMHVFRHTFATNCYYKGMPVKILSKILGHSSPSITLNVYIHLYGDEFEAMYEAMNK